MALAEVMGQEESTVMPAGASSHAAVAHLVPNGYDCFIRPWPYYPGGGQVELIARQSIPSPKVFSSSAYSPAALRARCVAQGQPFEALRPQVGLGMATQSMATVLLLVLVVVALPWREQLVAFFHRRGAARLFQVDTLPTHGLRSAIASRKITAGDAMWSFCLAYMLWLGILLWQPTIQDLGARIACLVVTSALFAALLLYRYVVLRMTKVATGHHAMLDLLWANANEPGRIFWIPMLLFLFVLTYCRPSLQWSLWIGGMGGIGAIFLLRIFKAVKTFRACRIGGFYLFLYLCTFELLPLLLMAKWLSNAPLAH